LVGDRLTSQTGLPEGPASSSGAVQDPKSAIAVRSSCSASGHPLDVVLHGAVLGSVLERDTVAVEETGFHLSLELSHGVGGEAELTGDEDLLTAGELEAGSVHSLLSELQVLGLSTDGHKDLIDGDTGGLDVGLTKSTSHTLLESISTSAGQHLVDTDGVPGVRSDSQMEGILSGVHNHEFVGSNTG